MHTQHDDNSCGPVALVNAYYYINNKFSPKTITSLCIECQTDNVYGTRR